MRGNLTKKFISFILVFIMIIGLIPTTSLSVIADVNDGDIMYKKGGQKM